MTGSRYWLSTLIVVGATGIVAAEEPSSARPRIVIGTTVVFDEPALPTYLTIMPRVVEDTSPLSAQLTTSIGGVIWPEPPAIAASTNRMDRSPPPATIPDSLRDSPAPPTYIVMPAQASNPQDEAGTAMLRQIVAVLGAIVVALFVVVVACVLVVRRRAPALFQVQVVGGASAAPEHPPMVPPVVSRSTYVAPDANFVLGPSFAEEAREREAVAERQSHAVFSQIATDNLVLRAELSRNLPVTEPAV